jgi:hypothetical protein
MTPKFVSIKDLPPHIQYVPCPEKGYDRYIMVCDQLPCREYCPEYQKIKEARHDRNASSV